MQHVLFNDTAVRVRPGRSVRVITNTVVYCELSSTPRNALSGGYRRLSTLLTKRSRYPSANPLAPHLVPRLAISPPRPASRVDNP